MHWPTTEILISKVTKGEARTVILIMGVLDGIQSLSIISRKLLFERTNWVLDSWGMKVALLLEGIARIAYPQRSRKDVKRFMKWALSKVTYSHSSSLSSTPSPLPLSLSVSLSLSLRSCTHVMYACTHTRTHVCMYMYAHARTHTHTHTHTHTLTSTSHTY